MRRVEGNTGVRLLECTSPVRDKWRVRWDVQVREDGSASYMEEEFGHKPTGEEIRSTVMAWYNGETDTAILSGFRYNDVPVWLSQENQFNYKSAYDLAVQTNGGTLPVTFKFGTDTEPHYRTFETLEELTDFYTKAMSHIRTALAEGWKKKDAFDLEVYQVG
ncbi:hypothetical protein AB9N12_01510 [Bacteroides sp. AN502(2024)]|uniref:DUF4376 domain-containing protein n=1 Tax=Bacteroides sp. AN502(2024) TaxID=3160599 RepID=UPI0035192CB8